MSALVLWMVYRHQRLLRERAELMRDAIRHRDFSFRLPTHGLLFGERALQETLNDLGAEILRQAARGETESWQRLTRVLAHEIMNAVAPIQSISQAYLNDDTIKDTPHEEGLRAIHDTSTGLIAFAENCRRLAGQQEAVMQELNLATFFRSLSSLYPQLEWRIELPEDCRIMADENLLRQVFLNMTRNAIEAEARSINVKGSPKGGFLFSNDGHAIPPSLSADIFTPFFTTKQKGSGIGLSLSRQLLMRQGMTLSLADSPVPGCNVTFVIGQ